MSLIAQRSTANADELLAVDDLAANKTNRLGTSSKCKRNCEVGPAAPRNLTAWMLSAGAVHQRIDLRRARRCRSADMILMMLID